MKKSLLLIASAAAFAACSVSELDEVRTSSENGFKIFAGIAQDDEMPQGKTTFTPGTLKVAWDADDALSAVVLKDGEYSGYKFVKSSSEDNAFVAEGDFDMSGVTEFNLFYPYTSGLSSIDENGCSNVAFVIGSEAGQPQKQTGVNSGDHIDAPLYALAEISEEGVKATMQHASALFEVTVENNTGVQVNVTGITLSNSGSHNMTGTFYINPETGALTPASASPTATLEVAEGTIDAGGTGNFYLTFAPFTLAIGENISVSVATAEGITAEYNSAKMSQETPVEAGKRHYATVVLQPSEGDFTLSETSVKYDFFTDPNPQTVTLSAVNLPEGASAVTWTTSDEYIVRVDDGVLTPVGHGIATITAIANDADASTATCTVSVNGVKDLNYGNGDVYYDKVYLPVNITLASGETQTWLDRNLGASQVATAYNDPLAYGSSFQWSRKADGHEQVTWNAAGTVGSRTNSSSEILTDRENTNNAFILTDGDWVSDASSDSYGLWGGGNATGSGISQSYAAALDSPTQVNNPCPAGYRLPSAEEIYLMIGTILGLDEEITARYDATTSNALNTLANSVLHFPASGYGNNTTTGGMTYIGSAVGLWCNTPASSVTEARRIHIGDTRIQSGTADRARGYSIRCIRDTALPDTSIEVQ